MHSVFGLWLPVLFSAVAVFILSFILHMVLPWHRGDFPTIPNEEAVMDALRPLAIPPGEYMVPRPSSGADMKSPAFLEKMNRGPVFMLRMLPNGMTPLGKFLGQWFIYLIIVAWLAGHVALVALHDHTSAHDVFHTVGLSSFMGYALALAQNSIWYRRSWKVTLKSILDGLLYGIVTGLIFAWLWPRA